MKTFTEYLLKEELTGEPIDDQWINDDKPVKTANGRKVTIVNVDIKEVPNIIYGQVDLGNGKKADYSWIDDGTCKSAQDQLGNPKKPSDEDNLVKA